MHMHSQGMISSNKYDTAEWMPMDSSLSPLSGGAGSEAPVELQRAHPPRKWSRLTDLNVVVNL